MSSATTIVRPATFGRALASEWIKLRSLRSSVWCAALIVLLTVGFGLSLAAFLTGRADTGAVGQRTIEVEVATLGVRLTQLIACILGVLVIGGEYATGMIRTTFLAGPRRWPPILAKLVVLFAATFVATAAATWLTALLSAPLLAGKGVPMRLAEPDVLLPLFGAAFYLGSIAVLACLVGVVVRNSAAGIAIILGLVLVVPTALTVIGSLAQANGILNLVAVLPSSAGARLYDYTGADAGGMRDGVLSLTPPLAALVLLGWIAIVGALAFVLVERRDV